MRRLERGKAPNAPLWWYVNCATALGLGLEDVLDDRDFEWHSVPGAPEPPGPEWPYRGEGRPPYRR
jgi:hypothetical protein